MAMNLDTPTILRIRRLSPRRLTAVSYTHLDVYKRQEQSYLHKGYTIRAGLKKEAVEVTPATEEAEAIYEDRITVSMSQRTYTESQLASLIDTVDVLVMDALMQ